MAAEIVLMICSTWRCRCRLSAGSVGPAYYQLGILDSFYVILVVDIMYVHNGIVHFLFSPSANVDLVDAPFQRFCEYVRRVQYYA